jgi:hypothetical protein
MIVVTQHIGPRDEAGITLGQVLECDCQPCKAGEEVKVLGRNVAGVMTTQHVSTSVVQLHELS